MTEEKFCRVCRCEGTPDQPLFHPCKCRGSIRYIHQDCLQYWLQHSNKDTCDICHSKFHFKVIYNDSVPNRLPLTLIIKQFLKDLIGYQYVAVKYLLMGFCALFEIPFVAKTFDRFIEWQLGIPLPANVSLLDSLLYGDHNPATSSSLSNLLYFFQNSVIPGLMMLFVYAVIIISMIMIQNSLVTDDGFQKIINKKIGMEPRKHELLKLLQQRRLREVNSHLDLIRKYDKARKMTAASVTLSDLYMIKIYSMNRVFILTDNPIPGYDYDRYNAVLQSFDPQLAMGSNDEKQTMIDIYTTLILDELRIKMNVSPTDTQFLNVIEGLLHNIPERDANIRPPQNDYLPNEFDDLLNRPTMEEQLENELLANRVPPAARRAPVPANLPQPQVPIDAEENDVAPIEGLLNGPKNITFILQITLLINLVSFLPLAIFKLVPSLIGNYTMLSLYQLLYLPLRMLLVMTLPYISPYIKSIMVSPVTHAVLEYYNNSIAPKLIVQFFSRNVYEPIVGTIHNTINYTPTSSTFERIALILTGFSTIAFFVYLAMKKLENSCTQNNPLKGIYRTVYIILLEIKSVVKIFILIAIEWVLFPLFCGIQIEFALVPIFNSDIYNYRVDPPLVGTDMFGLIPKWILGTFFMYYFASFVSMIRSEILRNGVLFFIRPSDDPNIQLIHDALMRPFSLRVSRIALSAAVYSLYIHIEFSMVSWGLRIFSPLKILPFYNSNAFQRISFAVVLVGTKFMENVFTRYWKYVFEYSCSLLRLSSFLLDKHIPEERGKIVYKTLFARLSNPKPDFATPVLESETNVYFAENPRALCCFVPDGNYVRAPDDDHVARKFVRTLFVPVTKSDQLLEPIPEYPDDEENYNPYNDVDPMDVTTYTIVYRPPNFKFRLFQLFTFLWLASMIFVLGFYILTISLGTLLLNLPILNLFKFESKNFYTPDVSQVLVTLGLLSRMSTVLTVSKRYYTEIKSSKMTNSDKFKLLKSLASDINDWGRKIYRSIVTSNRMKHVLFTLKLDFALYIFFGLCMNYVYGFWFHHAVFPKWGYLVLVTSVPLLVSALSSDQSKFNTYIYTCFLIAAIRLTWLTIQEYFHQPGMLDSELMEKIEKIEGYNDLVQFLVAAGYKPDGFIMQKIFLKYFPKWSRVSCILAISEFNGVESLTYFIIWILLSAKITYEYFSNAWKNFTDKTKELNYENMKVLSNSTGDDNNEDEDDDIATHGNNNGEVFNIAETENSDENSNENENENENFSDGDVNNQLENDAININ